MVESEENMTVKELIESLLQAQLDYEVCVDSPDPNEDYPISDVRINDTQHQVFIDVGMAE